MKVTNGEIMRYLKTGDTISCERTSMLIEEIVCLFNNNITPKSIYNFYNCEAGMAAVKIGELNITSVYLAKHLESCRYAMLLAATLGANADTLIRKYSIQDMEKTLIAPAVCAAMIEAYCDEIEDDFLRINELKGLFPVTRYSPGYGDFDITCQKDILKLLDAPRIGLSLTDGFMLLPSKSITAVIGFTEERKQVLPKCGANAKCALCADKNCGFREAAL